MHPDTQDQTLRAAPVLAGPCSCFPFCGDRAAQTWGHELCAACSSSLCAGTRRPQPTLQEMGQPGPAELLSPGLLARSNESLLTPGARKVHMQ